MRFQKRRDVIKMCFYKILVCFQSTGVKAANEKKNELN